MQRQKGRKGPPAEQGGKRPFFMQEGSLVSSTAARREIGAKPSSPLVSGRQPIYGACRNVTADRVVASDVCEGVCSSTRGAPERAFCRAAPRQPFIGRQKASRRLFPKLDRKQQRRRSGADGAGQGAGLHQYGGLSLHEAGCSLFRRAEFAGYWIAVRLRWPHAQAGDRSAAPPKPTNAHLTFRWGSGVQKLGKLSSPGGRAVRQRFSAGWSRYRFRERRSGMQPEQGRSYPLRDRSSMDCGSPQHAPAAAQAGAPHGHRVERRRVWRRPLAERAAAKPLDRRDAVSVPISCRLRSGPGECHVVRRDQPVRPRTGAGGLPALFQRPGGDGDRGAAGGYGRARLLAGRRPEPGERRDPPARGRHHALEHWQVEFESFSGQAQRADDRPAGLPRLPPGRLFRSFASLADPFWATSEAIENIATFSRPFRMRWRGIEPGSANWKDKFAARLIFWSRNRYLRNCRYWWGFPRT